MLAELYCIKSAVDFDVYKAIFIHNFSFIMFVFFIIVFWFFLNFVEVTISFEINDDQHVTKTAMRHVVCIQKSNSFRIMTCCRTFKNLSYRSYSEIFVWWFRYDLFQPTKGVETVRNDEIKVIIADHTHAWTEIWATYD